MTFGLRFFLSLGCGLLLSIWAGCAGYRLGPTNGLPAGAKSIQVNPFQNHTLEPRLIEPVVSALRKDLQQDGTYQLNTQDAGDIIVNGVITQLRRAELSYQPADILTVRDYSLQLFVKITARERMTGKVLVDQEVMGTTTIRVGADLASAERQAIPMLADDVARRATSLLVDGTW